MRRRMHVQSSWPPWLAGWLVRSLAHFPCLPSCLVLIGKEGKVRYLAGWSDRPEVGRERDVNTRVCRDGRMGEMRKRASKPSW